MVQVVLLMLRPVGRAGVIRQLDTVPVVVAVCVAALPIVSTTVEGVNDTVGLEIRTDKVNVVMVEPALLVAVIV